MTPRHPTIGALLRSFRMRNGWTLQQMSERAGIPRSTLTKIEHDRLTLTYDRLCEVSQRLNIRMSELFAEAEADNGKRSLVVARRSHGRVQDAIRVVTPNYDYYYMCPELRQKRMIPIVIRVRAKSLQEFGELVRHPGEEYVHILQGPLVLHTEFYDPLELEVGEAVYIDSNMGHAFTTSEGCDEGVMLSVCSSAEIALRRSLLTLHDDQQQSTDRSSMPAVRTG